MKLKSMKQIKEVENALNLKCYNYGVQKEYRADGRQLGMKIFAYFATEEDYEICEESNNYDYR